MRSSKSRSRNKSRGQRTLGNVVNRVFDSSGPEGKVRGTPQQIIEKYLALARDAQLSGDRVAEQSFFQHAEHYTRMLAEAAREQNERQQQSGQPGQQYGDDREDRQNGGQQGYDRQQNGQQHGQQNGQQNGGERRDNRDNRAEGIRNDRDDRRDDRRDGRRDDRRDGRRDDNRRDGSRDASRDGRRDDRAGDRPADVQPDIRAETGAAAQSEGRADPFEDRDDAIEEVVDRPADTDTASLDARSLIAPATAGDDGDDADDALRLRDEDSAPAFLRSAVAASADDADVTESPAAIPAAALPAIPEAIATDEDHGPVTTPETQATEQPRPARAPRARTPRAAAGAAADATAAPRTRRKKAAPEAEAAAED